MYVLESAENLSHLESPMVDDFPLLNNAKNLHILERHKARATTFQGKIFHYNVLNFSFLICPCFPAKAVGDMVHLNNDPNLKIFISLSPN